MPVLIRFMPTLGTSLFLTTTLAFAAPATLPDTDIRSETDADDPRTVEVSTATRTATAARSIPQVIDSVKTAHLSAYGINDLGTALSGIPNVGDGGDTRFDSLRIRGFDASYDFFLDGVRDDSQYKRDLHNIERIDVLKGPAAVLYGRGSQGGIVNRISKVPIHGHRSSVEAKGSSDDTRSLYADLSTDPTDAVSTRLNLGTEDYNSFRDGVSGSRTLFAPSVSWQLNPDLNWLAAYEYSRFDRTPDRGIPGLGGRPVPVDRATTYGAKGDYIDDRTHTLRSKLDYALDDHWQLRHTTHLFQLHSQFDNTFLTGYDAGTDKVKRARWQQDLTTRNLFNNTEVEGDFTALGLEHRLLVGVELGSQRRDPTLHTAAQSGPGSKPVPALDRRNPDRNQRHDGHIRLSSRNHTEVESRAVYVQDQLRFNEHWQLLGGLRYDQFDIETTNRIKGISERRSSRSASPRIGVIWTPLTDHSFYASWTKTFSPAGGRLIGITPGTPSNSNDLSPELTRQKEIGVKSDWLDQRLSTILAVYETELYNRRTTDPDNPDLYVLTGEQRSRGMELTATGNVIGDWYLRSGLGVQNAVIVKDNNGLQGNRVTNVAKRNGSVFISWKPKVGWHAESGVTFVGQRYADRANSTILPGYGRWDALAGYREKDWSLTAALKNVADKRHFRTSTGASQLQPGEPRTLVITATHKF